MKGITLTEGRTAKARRVTLQEMVDALNDWTRAQGWRTQYALVGRKVLWISYGTVVDAMRAGIDCGRDPIHVTELTIDTLRDDYASITKK